jgi:predicted glycosyl hydrolase (DUF1957 family)
MAIGEVFIGFTGGVLAAILGSYVTHRYSEHLEAENRRIKTNNVLRAVETEIRIVASLYTPTFKDLFANFPETFPRFEEAITGIESFRQNLELITSQTESNALVAEIIEMDQIWKLLSAEFRNNNRYHDLLESATHDRQREVQKSRRWLSIAPSDTWPVNP